MTFFQNGTINSCTEENVVISYLFFIPYEKMDGWIGYGLGGNKGELGIPYWFGYDEDKKYINASVEPSGLQFSALMDDEEWSKWVAKIKEIATEILGYKIGEIELGEVDY